MTQLIIKGAFYFNGYEVLKAHYTGEFFIVDCTEFKRKKEIKENYPENIVKEFLSNEPIIYEGKKYYQCEYSPHHTKDFVLLSDLSELTHEEDNFDF